LKPGTKSTLLAGDRIASVDPFRLCAIGAIIRIGLVGEGLTRPGFSGEWLI
jgi:hypothetical protein